jgi:hypothetical protein
MTPDPAATGSRAERPAAQPASTEIPAEVRPFVHCRRADHR